MKKILSFAISMAALFGGFLCAQNSDPVLMTVGNEQVTKSEFVKAYQKNSSLICTSCSKIPLSVI